MQRRTFAAACLAGALGAHASDERSARRIRWQQLVDRAGGEGADARLDSVNAQVNRLIDDGSDPDLVHWPTPAEALERGRGDCRAFAVLKYFALLAAGHPAADLRLLYAIQRSPDTPGLEQRHLVTWARAGGAAPRVLDNLVPFALPLAARADLQPVFSIDCEHLRSGDGDTIERPARDLRPWRELLERLDCRGGAALNRWSGCRPRGRCAD